jgi:hypothetical protein
MTQAVRSSLYVEEDHGDQRQDDQGQHGGYNSTFPAVHISFGIKLLRHCVLTKDLDLSSLLNGKVASRQALSRFYRKRPEISRDEKKFESQVD